ncbi:hypothetical protein DPMN_072860 [Dreissena polymorpha]|uniref:Uncharacterized protein n=1 Tax=Dreissena polymorpha TaxID=45954 RepID=A0A9D4BY19_DREPO|nr:hypothetical protein DPMN_072860 [Dreissena polymorpha]
MLAFLRQNIIPYQIGVACLKLKETFHHPPNIDPLVIIQKSRQVLENYLGTSMTCHQVPQDRNFVCF